MARWLDDFLFFLPGFASVPIVIAGMLGVWFVWRMMKRKKKKSESMKMPPKI